MSPRALGATLPKITKAILQKGGRDYAAVITEWPAIVGDALAGSSVPDKLTRRTGAAGGTLVIHVTSGAAMEFQHREPQLIERINAYLGHRAVDRLKLVQGPVANRGPRPAPVLRKLTPAESQAIDSQIAMIDDEDLKMRLQRFGRALTARGRTGASREK